MSLYVSINAKAMAYVLVVPKNKEEGDPTNVDIIKMGSRLLATCETHLMEQVNVGRCILFFLEQCPDLIKNVGKLDIYTTDQSVQQYFVDKYHSQHFDELDNYNYEFTQIQIDNDNPAAFLLLTRSNVSTISKDNKDTISRLYALRDTTKVRKIAKV